MAQLQASPRSERAEQGYDRISERLEKLSGSVVSATIIADKVGLFRARRAHRAMCWTEPSMRGAMMAEIFGSPGSKYRRNPSRAVASYSARMSAVVDFRPRRPICHTAA